jgi:hypothetical protein
VATPNLTDRDDTRDANTQSLPAVASSVADTVAAWSAKLGGIDVPRWTQADSLPGLRQRLANEGWLDFAATSEAWLVSWLASRGMWPDGMPTTVNLAELGLTPDDIEAQRSEVDRRREREQRRRRSVLLDDTAVSLDGEPADLVRLVLEGLANNPATLKAKLRVTKPRESSPKSTRGGRGDGRGGGGGSGGWDRSLTDDQKILIGLIGEISAYEWLDRQVGITPLSWRSTNRRYRFAGDPGDDSLGYDIALNDGSRVHYLEVKATTGDGSDGAIEMSVGEARFARSQIKGRYNILLVTNVLDSVERRFRLLPNPFSPDAVDLYRVASRGFRFMYRL